ncbi:hypothetical protein [Helicobacter sp. 11S03491-1]|uniref:hypothetical protein n=1 Tax=Helicobacter sp. 11S03491-1 TaxID=1476196 RepID=UPI000BA59349|nr:hypothetical protein [Helicobacter sp. 11S03491-1]PAF43904.1 hypothetical protein BKH45_01175 [Helicobacter sp. 11S03491-1]
MDKIITLHIQDTPQLRIARNFLIISVLIYMLSSLIYFLFLLNQKMITLTPLIIVSFILNMFGIYKLSKLGRNIRLFKYYMFLVLGSILYTLIMALLSKIFLDTWNFDLTMLHLESSQDKGTLDWLRVLIGFLMMGYVLLYFYCIYKIASELTGLSGDKLFLTGYKIVAFCFVLVGIGLLLLTFSVGFAKILMTFGGIGMIGGFFVFISGFFRLKQITYSIPYQVCNEDKT